jgi:putative ABC transport system permease protein
LTELAHRDLELVGSFNLGFDFGAEGTLVVGYETFADYLRRPIFPGWHFEEVELGLIRLESGKDPFAVRDALRAALQTEGDVDVVTRDELRNREIQYWIENTPIGFTFGFGMWMGFLVGLVICFQILTSDVKDHLPQYATLRAIGYPNGYLTWVVFQEALLLAVVGFMPGWLVSWGVYRWLAWSSGLPMRLTWDRILCVLGLTVGMCLLSGLAAIREVKNADPADVFG